MSSRPRRLGPSPRARGARCSPAPQPLRRGTIPAGAGSTQGSHSPGLAAGDHPRGRGEHSGSDQLRGATRGPSPRARGALTPRGDGHAHRGTIPAGAGSTTTCPPGYQETRDHPRGRGEHGGPAVGHRLRLGPSPRARGALVACDARIRRPGTIPAGAGSTSTLRSARATHSDHPRGRGEHPGSGPTRWAGLGPSPRARGARHHGDRSSGPCGTIPAGAGSTRCGEGSAAGGWDHPRGRGEHPLW